MSTPADLNSFSKFLGGLIVQALPKVPTKSISTLYQGTYKITP
jgi:hypothetical protein